MNIKEQIQEDLEAFAELHKCNSIGMSVMAGGIIYPLIYKTNEGRLYLNDPSELIDVSELLDEPDIVYQILTMINKEQYDAWRSKLH